MLHAEQALDILSQYTELAVSNIYPLHLHGDNFFDLLDEWLDSELVLRSFPPRDETLIRHSMTQALNENPVFLPLAKDSRFQMMVNAQEICTRYGLIDQGILLASGTIDELRARVFTSKSLRICASAVPDKLNFVKCGINEFETQIAHCQSQTCFYLRTDYRFGLERGL